MSFPESGNQFKELACPNCGAPGRAEEHDTLAVCAHCGTRLQIASGRLVQQAATGGDALDAQIRQMLTEGHKIQAIKLYREQTSVGLKEAKDAVEAIERELPRTAGARRISPVRLPGRATTSGLRGCLPIIAVIAACVGSIALLSHIMFRVFGPFDQALQLARAHPAVVEAFGTPIDPGLFVFGGISSGFGSSHVQFEVPIFGPRHSGYLRAMGAWSGGPWDLSVWVVFDRAGEEVSIFMESEP